MIVQEYVRVLEKEQLKEPESRLWLERVNEKQIMVQTLALACRETMEVFQIGCGAGACCNSNAEGENAAPELDNVED